MLNLEFEDFIESKYIVTGQFKEGLARVKNHNNLYGYIDKKGKEVIPCQFTKAFDFSEGLAAVSNEENLFGFIDTNGELKIPFKYNENGESVTLEYDFSVPEGVNDNEVEFRISLSEGAEVIIDNVRLVEIED